MKRINLINSSGIYEILSTINGKRYIGSSINIRTRILNNHLHELKKGKHKNKYLQNHFNKHGSKVFQFSILELCKEDVLLEREQYYIDTLNPEFNQNKIAGPFNKENKHPKPWKGEKFSEEHKRKLSENHADVSGEKNPAKRLEVRKKISEANKGRKHRFHKGKPITQMNLEGNYIMTYEKIKEASRKTGVNSGNISSCIHGKLKTAGGFLWKFS